MEKFKSILHSTKGLLWRHRVGLLILFVCMIVPLALLEDLMEGVHKQHNWAFDEQILHAVHNHASAKKDFVVLWTTKLGYWVAWPMLAGTVALLHYIHNNRGAAYLGISVLGAGLMDGLVKMYFGRVRPDLWTSILPESSFSFPSGHSMISAALGFAVVVLLWPTKWRLPALILAPPTVFLIGLSRIYLGVHYPSDVLGGWCGGLIWAAGAFFIVRPLRTAPKISS